MKRIFLLLPLLLLLSACLGSANAQQSTVMPAGASSTPTADPMQNLIRTSVESALNAGPHSEKLSCTQCHATENGVIVEKLAWSAGAAQQPESVASSSDLCGQCHVRQHQERIDGQQGNLAHPDFTCTGCHDPHSTQASCTQSACHSEIQRILSAKVEKPTYHPTTGDDNGYMCGGSACHDLAKDVAGVPIYHRPVHRDAPCTVCHDAAGFPAGKAEDQSWVTVAEAGSGEAIVSHRIGREVECAKCHFSGNPWNLVEILPGG